MKSKKNIIMKEYAYKMVAMIICALTSMTVYCQTDTICFKISKAEQIALLNVNYKECLSENELMEIEITKLNKLIEVIENDIADCNAETFILKDNNKIKDSQISDLNKQLDELKRKLRLLKIKYAVYGIGGGALFSIIEVATIYFLVR